MNELLCFAKRAADQERIVTCELKLRGCILMKEYTISFLYVTIDENRLIFTLDRGTTNEL